MSKNFFPFLVFLLVFGDVYFTRYKKNFNILSAQINIAKDIAIFHMTFCKYLTYTDISFTRNYMNVKMLIKTNNDQNFKKNRKKHD